MLSALGNNTLLSSTVRPSQTAIKSSQLPYQPHQVSDTEEFSIWLAGLRRLIASQFC